MNQATTPVVETSSGILDGNIQRLSISPSPNDEDSIMDDAPVPKPEPTVSDQDRLTNAGNRLRIMRDQFKTSANEHMDLVMKFYTNDGTVKQEDVDEHKERLDRMKAAIAAFEEAFKNCQQAEDPQSATEVQPKVEAQKKETMAVLGNDSPRFGPKTLGAGKPYNVISKAHVFLDKFHAVLSSSYGTNFKSMAHRLLIVAVLIDDTQRRLKEALDEIPEPQRSWEKCEEVFIDITLTPQQRQAAVQAVISGGIRKNELYREFSYRIRRSVRLNKLPDTDRATLEGVKQALPSMVNSMVELKYMVTSKKDMQSLTSIREYCYYLETIDGPDEANAKKRALESDSDSDDSEPSPSKKSLPSKVKGRADSKGPKPSGGKYYCANGHGDNNSHDTKDCKVCGQCGKPGHLADNCRNGRGDQGSSNNRSSSSSGHNAQRQRPFNNHRGNDVNAIPIVNARSLSSQAITNAKVNLPPQGPALAVMPTIAPIKVIPTTLSNVLANTTIKDLWGNKNGVNKVCSTTLHKVATNCMNIKNAGVSVHALDDSNASSSNEEESSSIEQPCNDAEIKDHEAWYQIEQFPLDDEQVREFERISMEESPDVPRNMYSVPWMPINYAASLVQSQKGLIKKKAKETDEDNRLFVDVIICGEKHKALLDTGASHSFISTELVKRYDLKIKEAAGSIELADKSLRPRIGETENIDVICGKNILSAPFEVIEQKHAIAIGMDLFYHFGFGVSGLPDVEVSSRRLPDAKEDERPTLKPPVTPKEESTPEFIKLKTEFDEAIQSLLEENKNIPPSSHCPVEAMKVYLPVPKGTIVHRRARPIPYAQRPIVDQTVEAWLQSDVVTLAPVGNPHNNTLTLAAKKDANGDKTLWRVCLDPRPLNVHLPDDKFPVPLISDIMQQIAGNSIYTTIDLTQAYHRLPIHEEDRPLTAFMHNGKQYMFKKAPFGLKPLSSLFQRGMSRILGDLPFVCFFIDDIVIFSKNREDHAEHVKQVIERLNEAKLIINKNKCNFFSTQIALLGFLVDLHGKRVDPNKLANINEWMPPTNATEVQSYMGTFNFFREYIPLFSTIAAPLDALRNKYGTFKLTAFELSAFESLKRLLVNAPILSFADFSKPFYVATDASNFGIGAVLYQLPDGEDHPEKINYISFMARSLQQSERKYSATRKELLAIVFALKKFHYYLWGRHFTLFTDHRALTFIHTQKDLNSMMTNWHDTILDYTFKVVYRPGILNILPDALSRQFPTSLWTSRTNTVAKKVYGYIHLIQDGQTPRVTVPMKERRALLADVHALGHFGTNAMVKQIHEQGKTWPNLAKECLEFVQRCPECQKVNIAKKGYHPMKAIHATLPGEHMAVDLAGPFTQSKDGNVYLLVLVDVCTRFAFLTPIPNKKGMTIAKELFKTFSLIGFPRILQSDNGKEFVNTILRIMSEECNVQHRFVTPYHPRGNGVAEKHVQTAKEIVKKEVKGIDAAWDTHIPMTQLAMNTKIVALHNSSPFSLFFARRFNGFQQNVDTNNELLSTDKLLERLKYMTETVFPAIDAKSSETQRKMIERFNRTILHNEFPDGSKVMTLDPVLSDALSPRYEGPFVVVRKNTGGAYVLKDGTGKTLGRNYAPSQLKLVLDDYDDNPTYEVEEILNHRNSSKGKGVEYLVKWKDYSSEFDTWEPEENFIERHCIRKYWGSREPQSGSKSRPQSRHHTQISTTSHQEQGKSSARKSKRRRK